MNKFERIRHLADFLRNQLPPGWPVEVRFTDIKHSADVGGGEKKLIICIRKKDCYRLMIDNLIHEWAHALDNPWVGCREEHRDSWGVQYSRVYRLVTDYRTSKEGKKKLWPSSH